jgi:hypothetical protein
MGSCRESQSYIEHKNGSAKNKIFLIFKLIVNIILKINFSIISDQSLANI